jgi:hypothetical protein
MVLKNVVLIQKKQDGKEIKIIKSRIGLDVKYLEDKEVLGYFFTLLC